jgi:Reverse transcriptase (RNA-dependent DNA polymerase)
LKFSGIAFNSSRLTVHWLPLPAAAYEIRFADDFILCFQYRADAEKVLDVLEKRFRKYGLTLHPDKTRLMEFGRKALAKAEKPGGAKPATFDFLGLTHICKRSRRSRAHSFHRDTGTWPEIGTSQRSGRSACC